MRDKAIRALRVLLLSSCLVAIACLLPMHLRADSQTPFYQDDATRKIDFGKAVAHLKASWKTGGVERIEIVHIPTNTVYRKSVSTSTLDATYVFKLIVREPKDSQVIEDLVQNLEKLRAKPLGRPVDLRWGCVFYSAGNTRLLGIYFDSRGLEGVVDGACVGFDSNLLKQWAERSFANAFR